MKKYWIFCLCLFLSLSAAHAEWKLGAHACGIVGGNLDSRENPGLGAQLVYIPNYIYSLELAVSRYKAELNGDTDLNVTAVAATARVHASPVTDRFSFYGGAGAGIFMRDFFDSRGSDDDNKIRTLVSIGAEFNITERFDLFAEYRYVFMNLAGQDSFDHGLARIGLNCLF